MKQTCSSFILPKKGGTHMTRPLPTMTDEEQARWRPAPGAPGSDDAQDAGFGALTTARGCLPLKSLDVRVRLNGLVAGVALTQTFVNAHDEPLEATYVFPLPDRAAVTRFRLEVAGRVIEGALKERGAARREYDQALRDGHRAAITEEERPGVFTLRVGNLPPGEEATVRLDLAGLLPYSDGEATFRFPLVVAPRYIPGVPLPGPSVGDGTSPDTDAVPDASRISPPVLLPGFPNPVRLSLTVEVPASPLAPTAFRSSLHAVVYEENDRLRRIRLQPCERLDRDFLLRYRLADDRIRTALSVQPDHEGDEGTFLLTLVPPASSAGPGTRPRDVVFVLDRSGSMAGWKMVAARRALARMVDTLTDQDRFTVLAFDNYIETPPGFDRGSLLPATDRLRFRAVEFLARIDARGGTEMAGPLDQAVTRLAETAAGHAGRERILVLVTDGQVGNEDQILRQLGPRVKGLRIFTLGIDRAVNAGFLKRLADLTGGLSELVESEERLDEVMDHVHRHIGTPVLTNLRLEPAGLTFVPGSLVPARLPDLFAGAPLFVLGRYRGRLSGALALQARDAAGLLWSGEVAAVAEPQAPLAPLWARGRVRDLEDRYIIGTGDPARLEQEIVGTSLRFGVLCRFTAFVAVDRSEVVNPGGQVHGVVQPVEMPEGWAEHECLTCSAMPALARTVLGAARGAYRAPAASAGATDFEAAPAPRARRKALRDMGKGLIEFKKGVKGIEETPTGRPNGPGLIQRLLGRFRGGKRRANAPILDREPYRQCVADLLQALRSCPSPDAATRLGVLRTLFPRLEALFKDLATAGDRDPSVKRLGELLLKVQALLKDPSPAEAAVHDLLLQTEAVLQDWLASAPVALPAPQPKEGFWK
jgi:Ca-activated chloride channel family protein